jgi:ABC-type lipoprotein export system ATPase subunit
MLQVFSINKLSCSYGPNLPTVLKIDDLEILSGKLIFLLGASGSGKSTLLETLGLMNNAISSGEVTFHSGENQEYNYTELWKDKTEDQIAQIRRKHFNFIFQNTNLMENFTAYENVCMSRMIKEQKHQDEIIEGVRTLMQRVRLPESEVNTGTLAMNLSGGQRQRLAFVRALSANSTVLLCDEPTGNLDEANANELFEVINEHLTNGLTAVVVSHDIDLAIKHADQIVLLTKNLEEGHGEIKKENVFNRNFWISFSEGGLSDFKDRIKGTFIAGTDHVLDGSVSVQKNKFENLGFRNLFFKRESKALAGIRYVNFFVMCALFLFSFIAIGFGNGSLRYLKNELSSAFVNWLTISVPIHRSGPESLNPVISDLNRSDLREEYHYDAVTTYKIATVMVYNPREKDSLLVKGRTFDVVGDRKFINEELISKKNRIHGNIGFTDPKDLSIIVTKDFLHDYGYPEDTDYIAITFPVISEDSSKFGEHLMPVPIRAIVDELPGRSMFGCTEYFYQAYMLHANSPFNPALHKFKLDYFIAAKDSVEAITVFKLIRNAFITNSVASKYIPNSDPDLPEKHFRSFRDGWEVRMSLLSPDVPSFQVLDSVNQSILQLPELVKYQNRIRRLYNYDQVAEGQMQELKFDVLSVYFNSLKKVGEFKKVVDAHNTLQQRQSLNAIVVDLSKIKEKEHFLFLSSVALIVSYIIIIFGSISVSLFIFNLLKMHLNKVKMNIGTFKAIGLGK